ncbi:hypothetical protein CLV24_1173 [Pontibacter ummariensis]|uniref:DUF6602 domain-containing protein n=1 Tax=Pontibacter ummariensis TaxID=1610492 RepID=A0A239IDM3_9BACT|nr:DUF6602 domain-containing protein [Pontibacter ummariensis]PRY09799.1 hypothetical protein CLV24_1173 [Pontibacter ummariensis]SNS91647.1 hypothetical protein SAMN06296052_1173 [Pontibacter ummariensis]
MGKTNDLVDFMLSLTREMGDEYNRIQKRSTEDQGTAGDQGEENWASIFKNWLPADYQVVTKGRLLSEKGVASPQVDVIILRPFYPKHLLDKKLYLTAGVAAAFECKNTLKASHIVKTVQNSVEVRNLLNIRQGNYRDEIYSPIIYGLLAHSHSWKGAESKPKNVIEEKLHECDRLFVTHPREMLDFVCVSDLALWSSYKLPMNFYTYQESGNYFYKWMPGPQTGYGFSEREAYTVNTEPYKNFTPIGAFLSKLFKKLALHDNRLIDFSHYFGQTIGGGASIKFRTWPENILSEGARTDLLHNQSLYQGNWMSEG